MGRVGAQILRVRFGLHGLTYDVHRNVIADLRYVPPQAEIRALERRHGLEANGRQTGARIGTDPDDGGFEDHWAGHAMETEVAGHFESLPSCDFLYSRAGECRRGIFRGVEEVGRPEVIV